MSDTNEELKKLGREAKHDYHDGYSIACIADDLVDALEDAEKDLRASEAERDDLVAYLAKTLDNIEDETRGWTIADVREFITSALPLAERADPVDTDLDGAVEWCVKFDYDRTDIGGPFSSVAEAESLLHLSGLPGAVFRRGGTSGPSCVFQRPEEAADAILAAGFGDMAGVKAAAWDEGHEVGGSNYGEGDPDANPYRTTDTNGASE